MIATKLARFAALVIVLGCVSTALGQSGWSLSGSYYYDDVVHDDYQAIIGMPTVDEKFKVDTVAASASGSVAFSTPITPVAAQVSDQKANANISILGQVGSFHLLVSVNALSTHTEDFAPLNRVDAHAETSAAITFADQVKFKDPKHPGRRLVHAKWTITNDSETIAQANGVIDSEPDGNGHSDVVVSKAEAMFDLTGTGVPAAPSFPNPNGGVDNSAWAYSYAVDGGVRQPTIDHIEYDNPSSIDVTFLATPGQTLNVSWTFAVSANATVANSDLNMGHGSAFGASDFGHTITWGGITSVVDADTGELDTDWTVESASGLDYSQPVPEPTTLLLAGIGGIGIWLHRKRRLK